MKCNYKTKKVLVQALPIVQIRLLVKTVILVEKNGISTGLEISVQGILNLIKNDVII